jgi:hypothetical protein
MKGDNVQAIAVREVTVSAYIRCSFISSAACTLTMWLWRRLQFMGIRKVLDENTDR